MVIECKYYVRPQSGQSDRRARSVREYAGQIEEKFAHAEAFISQEFSTTSPSPKYVVFAHDVAPIAREDIECYLLERGATEEWKICDTEALREALEKAGVHH